MNYKFDITLTDNDYLDYNLFYQNKSPYGKKQIKSIRWLLVGIFAVIMLISLYGGGFSASAFINIIPMAIALIIMQLFLNKILLLTLKNHIKMLKKT